jgi:alkylation response protein AidB-like acyl-CoA dehydrogenase
MLRSVYSTDHDELRKTIRSFLEREVVPDFDDWYAAGAVPREMYLKLGELGIFGIEVPEQYGGAGIASYKYTAVINEETALAGVNFGRSQPSHRCRRLAPSRLTEVIREGMQAGILRTDLDPDDLTTALWAMLNGLRTRQP